MFCFYIQNSASASFIGTRDAFSFTALAGLKLFLQELRCQYKHFSDPLKTKNLSILKWIYNILPILQFLNRQSGRIKSFFFINSFTKRPRILFCEFKAKILLLFLLQKVGVKTGLFFPRPA